MADMEFEVGANTTAAQQGFQGVQAITNLIRQDIEAINKATEDLTAKATKMREFWEENVEELEGMKSILEIIKTTTQINQSALDNNLQRIQEILSSVRGLGGNMGQAMSMLGLAGSPGYGYGSYTGRDYGYGSSPLASQDFTGTSNAYQEYVLQNPASYVKNPNALMNRMMLRDSNPYTGTVAGVGGGGRRNPPPPTSSASYSDDDDEYQGMFSDRVEPYNTNQGDLRDQLSRYKNMNSTVPVGDEARAATYAYKDLMNNINRVAGTGRIGSRLAKAAQKALGNSGISPYEIQKAQQNAEVRNIPDPITGQPTPYYERSAGYSDIEKKTIKIADQVAHVFGSNLMKAFTKYTGYVNMAGAIYGSAVDVANQIRQITGFAQQQGQVFGQTDYGRTAGMTAQAFLKSGFNLNPFYSMQDVMQAQMSGGALGLKGAGLSNYVNQAMNFKKNYGLDAQQTQQILGAGLASGVGINANAAAFGQVRQLENTTQTSTAYGNQAYLQGMTSFAGMGAQGAVAAQLGVNAANFGAGNFVLQSMGATGTEGMGSTLNNALMAQNLGTSYLGLYAAERTAGAGKLAKAQNASQGQILGWAGIDANAKYKGKNDFFNKNSDKAMVLQMILGTMQGYQKEAQSPQNALNWAWGVVQQKNQLAHPGKKKSDGNSFWGGIGKGLEGAFNVVAGSADYLAAGVIDIGTLGAGRGLAKQMESYSMKRFSDAGNEISSGNAELANWSKNKSFHTLAGSMRDPTMGSSNVHVTVGLHPSIQHQFTAAVKTGNQGNKTGERPPNYQPTSSRIL